MMMGKNEVGECLEKLDNQKISASSVCIISRGIHSMLSYRNIIQDLIKVFIPFPSWLLRNSVAKLSVSEEVCSYLPAQPPNQDRKV